MGKESWQDFLLSGILGRKETKVSQHLTLSCLSGGGGGWRLTPHMLVWVKRSPGVDPRLCASSCRAQEEFGDGKGRSGPRELWEGAGS